MRSILKKAIGLAMVVSAAVGISGCTGSNREVVTGPFKRGMEQTLEFLSTNYISGDGIKMNCGGNPVTLVGRDIDRDNITDYIVTFGNGDAETCSPYMMLIDYGAKNDGGTVDEIGYPVKIGDICGDVRIPPESLSGVAEKLFSEVTEAVFEGAVFQSEPPLDCAKIDSLLDSISYSDLKLVIGRF